jgi:hypothetical protein
MNRIDDNLDSLLNRPAVTHRNLAGNADPTPQPVPQTAGEMLEQASTLFFEGWDVQGGEDHATPRILVRPIRLLLTSPPTREAEPDRYGGHLFHASHNGQRVYCFGLCDLEGWSETMMFLLHPKINPDFFRRVAAAGCVIIAILAQAPGAHQLTVAIHEEQFTDALAYVTGPQGSTRTGGE